MAMQYAGSRKVGSRGGGGGGGGGGSRELRIAGYAFQEQLAHRERVGGRLLWIDEF